MEAITARVAGEVQTTVTYPAYVNVVVGILRQIGERERRATYRKDLPTSPRIGIYAWRKTGRANLYNSITAEVIGRIAESSGSAILVKEHHILDRQTAEWRENQFHILQYARIVFQIITNQQLPAAVRVGLPIVEGVEIVLGAVGPIGEGRCAVR